jgi:putative hemolysin
MKILARVKNATPLIASILLSVVMATKSARTPTVPASWGDSSNQAGSVSQPHKIGNPAAVYCTDMGYDYQVIGDEAGGQTDTCSMPDGSVCSAWDFLEGKCGQAYSYCAKHGMGERTATDGKNAFSQEYAICVDARGKDIGHVTELDNLAPKLIHCGTTNEPTAVSSNSPAAALPALPDSRPPLALTGTPPTSWDWRNASYNGISGNWTSPVKNQGSCGSCWAFAAVGQTEAVLNLAANNPALDKDLSEEYLVTDHTSSDVNCSTSGSCCGGWHSIALDFIKNKGIPDESCLTYVSGTCGCYGSGTCSCNYDNNKCSNSTCSQRCSNYASRLSKIDAYGSVSSNQTAIKQALITYGPLSVAMDMTGHFNASSVYTCTSSTSVDHSVVIVGYNDAGGYWIVKNSWGSTWNGNGFFKVGYGQCLIEDYVYYAHAAPVPEMNNHIFLPVVTR